ncbi:MAG: hypothetical protein J6Q06_02400, partial [Clostridia bacterium]|nr:hypothetical protein [Clostridia bacterium]
KDVYSDSINSDKYIFNLGERCFLATKASLKKLKSHLLMWLTRVINTKNNHLKQTAKGARKCAFFV